MGEMVRFLHRLGINTQVLTTRWHSSWPSVSNFYEVPLARILPASTSAWNEAYFQRNLWTWVERNCGTFDACLVDSLELIASTKLSSALKEKTIFLRVDLNNPRDQEALKRPSSTLQWLASSSRVRFLAQSAADHRTILGAGVPSSQIVRMEPTIGFSPRSNSAKESARNILGSIGIDFLVPERFPLVVLPFDGEDYSSENQYLQVLTRALENHATFRAWVIGANDHLRRHHAYLRELGLHHDVLLHSSFDDLNIVIDAADFVATPILRDAKSFYYPQAIARGIATPFTNALVQRLSQGTDNIPLGELMNSVVTDVSVFEKSFQEFVAEPKSFESSAVRLQQRTQWLAIEKYNNDVWRELLSLR
jgi:hypothetical protein